MGNPIGINEALQALENLFDFCEEIDLHLPDEEKTGYQMLPDYLLVNQYIKDNERKRGNWVKMPDFMTVDANKHYCSLCGGHAPHDRWGRERKPEWCPGCGARMVEYNSDQQDACYEHTNRDCGKCDHTECKYKAD